MISGIFIYILLSFGLVYSSVICCMLFVFCISCYASPLSLPENDGAIEEYGLNSGESDDLNLHYTGIDHVYVMASGSKHEGFSEVKLEFINRGVKPFVLENVYPRDIFTGRYKASFDCEDIFFDDASCYAFTGILESEFSSYSHFELRYYDQDGNLKKKRVRPWGKLLLLDYNDLWYDFSRKHSLHIKNIFTDDLHIKEVGVCNWKADKKDFEDCKFNSLGVDIDVDILEPDEVAVVAVPAQKNGIERGAVRTIFITYSVNGDELEFGGLYLYHRYKFDD